MVLGLGTRVVNVAIFACVVVWDKCSQHSHHCMVLSIRVYLSEREMF